MRIGWCRIAKNVIKTALFVLIIRLDFRTRFDEIITRFISLPAWVIYSHCATNQSCWLLLCPRAIYPAESNEPMLVCGTSCSLFYNRSLHLLPLGKGIHGNQLCSNIKTSFTGLIPRGFDVKELVAIDAYSSAGTS